MKTQDQNQQEKTSQNNTDVNKNNQAKNQTPAEKNKEQNLTEKDVNPSKEEKRIVQENGKGEQQTGNKATNSTIKPQTNNSSNSHKK
jgi:hypothetical protein